METAPEFQFSKKSNFRHFVRETRTRWKFVTSLAPRARHDFRRLCYKGNMITGPEPRGWRPRFRLPETAWCTSHYCGGFRITVPMGIRGVPEALSSADAHKSKFEPSR